MAHRWGVAKKAPLPKICHTYPTMMKLGTVIPYLKKIQKIYESCDTPLDFCWHQHHRQSANFAISRNTDIDCVLIISNSFKFYWVFKDCFNKHGYNFDDASKKGLRKIKIFWKKGYDVIVSVNGITNKTLSRDSNYIVDVVMWPKFGNFSIFMREFIITSSL